MTVKETVTFIRMIPYIITEDQAKKWLTGCGKILNIEINKSEMYIKIEIECSSEEEVKKASGIIYNKEFPRSPRSYVKGQWG